MSNAIEALLEACERRANENGALHFRDNQTKRQGVLYLRAGKVYAAELADYVPPIVNRLIAGGHVDSVSDLDAAVRAANGERSLNLPYLLLQRQIVDEASIREIVKDYFLYISSDILSWQSIKATWRKGTEIRGYPIPEIEGGRLIEVIAKRNANIQNMVNMFSVTHEELLNKVVITPLQSAIKAHLSNEEQAIVTEAKEYRHVSDISNVIGMTNFAVLRLVYKLWDIEIIDLYLNGVNLREAEEVEEDENANGLEFPGNIVTSHTSEVPDYALRPSENYNPLDIGDLDNINYIPSEENDDDDAITPPENTISFSEDDNDEAEDDEELQQVVSPTFSLSLDEEDEEFKNIFNITTLEEPTIVPVEEEPTIVPVEEEPTIVPVEEELVVIAVEEAPRHIPTHAAEANRPALAKDDDLVSASPTLPVLAASISSVSPNPSTGENDWSAIFAQLDGILTQVKSAISETETEIRLVSDQQADIRVRIEEVIKERETLDVEEKDLNQSAKTLADKSIELTGKLNELTSRFTHLAATIKP